ncbi:MAG TPA: restriction endonuclease subunit S [Candidatus Competibacter sp.]|nr:restriction endonuclease subunit S [Candidatus Competibacter sp.]
MSEFVTLGDHISVQKGKAPLANGYAGKGAEPYLNPEYLRGRAHAELVKAGPDAVRAVDGDTILLWDGSNAGEFFRAKAGLVASTMAKISPSKVFCAAYFLHVAKYIESYLKSQTNGTGIPHVDRDLLEAIRTFCPNSTEQRVIAAILDTLDTAIHKTEAIIAKLKAVKQGLLHDLLTRGIDANGELRPPQAEAPHLYKQSPLGWIPKEWDSKQLAELLGDIDPAMRSGPFGSALLKQELVEAGLPLLGIDNVHTERFVADYTRFVTPKKFAQLVRYAVRPDDLMITIMGTVGRCCLVPEDIGQALSSKHTWTISLNQNTYSPYLAMLQVNYSPWVLRRFACDQQGGTMAAIRSETLRSMRLPAPPREEQRLMEERLHEVSKRIDLEVDSLAKHHAEKSGLMDDLLTGRVRVTPLLEATAP